MTCACHAPWDDGSKMWQGIGGGLLNIMGVRRGYFVGVLGSLWAVTVSVLLTCTLGTVRSIQLCGPCSQELWGAQHENAVADIDAAGSDCNDCNESQSLGRALSQKSLTEPARSAAYHCVEAVATAYICKHTRHSPRLKPHNMSLTHTFMLTVDASARSLQLPASFRLSLQISNGGGPLGPHAENPVGTANGINTTAPLQLVPCQAQ